MSILTAQYDNARTAANLNETTLNTSNVNQTQFGRLFSSSLDGNLYAQPLYVPNVVIPGKGTHNVIYVATMHNTVAAFDADDPSQAGPLWQVNLGLPVPCCPSGFITPEIGVLSTPVIDPASSTLYVVAATLENGSYFHRLHALDVTTGQEKFEGPVVIAASVPGNGPDSQGGTVTLKSVYQLQRSGLLLANGTVYFSFASIDDGGLWHGWLLGYNASNVQQQVAVYNSTPNGNGGGIWQSGRGLVSDANGNVYSMSGNGDYDGVNNFGDSLVKLSTTGAVTDWFTPDNQPTLSLQDEDLASGGPLLIPNTTLLVGGGKQGVLYLVDSSNMGHLQTGNGQIVQNFQATSTAFNNEIHDVAYWNRSGAPLLYVWGSRDVLKAYQFASGTFNTIPVSQGGLTASFPGGVMAVSANGNTAGSGILWATTASADTSQTIQTGTLHAYDASNISDELWNSDQNAARDSLGNFAKFAVPTIANGKVYVSTFSNQLAVYGLIGSSTGVSVWVGPSSVTLAADGQQQQFSATVAGTSNTAVTWSISPNLGTITSNGLYTAPFPGAISSSQKVTITATSVADPTKSATATVTLNPVSTTGLATFTSLDTTTQGNWKGVYGSNGYNVINDTVSYPSYVTVTPSLISNTTWVSSTTDVRALLKANSSTDRIAATWYSTSSFLIDMVFNDGLQHKLAIYCLDWDSTARSERIDVLDANGVLLNTQTVSSFHDGQYLVWQLSGHVQIKLTTLSGSNAVISGLFFDTTAAATSFNLTGPSGGALNTASSNFTVSPNGTYNGTITITPSGGGLSSPITLTFSNSAAPQTFTITATAVGPVTLTPSNSGSLTNPSALTYATPPGAPTIGTATAGNAQATVSFTAPASTGGSAITSYTATCGTQTSSGATSPITVTGLTNGTTYTCMVTATNAEGASAPSAASNSVTPSVSTGTTGTATFVSLDTTTQGNWKGVYGANGYNVINNTVAYPSYVTVTPSGANAFTWASSTTDVRALLKVSSSTDRIAATWYNGSSFVIDMVFNDGQQHQFAIYCLDWDTSIRSERIDIVDANGVLLNTETVSGFHNGQYLVWQLTGHVQVKVTNLTASANAVISGLFFDTTAAASFSLTGPSGGALNTASSNFTVSPNGTYNGTITITPSGGGLSSPITLTFSNSAAPQTFTITPTAVGPVTLTPSNSGSLTNPSALTYATPPSASTIGTATPGNAQATVSFTAPASTGGSAITSYTATCGTQSTSGATSPITVTGLTNGTTYTCTVTATNAEGVSAPSAASNSVAPSVSTGTTGTAMFTTLDTTTQGNWKGVYGANGYNVINNTVAYPSYVTVTPSGANAFTWASSTTDVRALLKASSSTDRIAATWYNGSSFVIDMVFNDGQQHQFAIYCLDWDTSIRSERIDIVDANGVLLNTETVSGFHNGQYLVWQLTGHVQVKVTSLTASANAVISGLFFQ